MSNNIVRAVINTPYSQGFGVINPISSNEIRYLKSIQAGNNIELSGDSETIIITASSVIGSGVNTIADDINGTGQSLISGASTLSDVKLKTIIGVGNQINQVGGGDIEIENLVKIEDSANITGQSLIKSQSGYETFLKSIKAGAGVSVSTVADDIVISGSGAIYNPTNEIYIDASYTGTENGTASEPFITLDTAITYLNTLPLGNYVFILNQGNYSTTVPWNYPMGDGYTTTKSLSMVGKVANGCVITSDINFIGIALEPANFQINSIALVGTLCTMDFSAHTSGEFNSVTITNGFINNLDYTGPPLGNPSLIGFIRAGTGSITCLYNGPTLQNAFLIGNINLTTANSRISINSSSNVNCTLTLSNGAIANISGLVSTTNTNWLVSGDANLNIFKLDAWSASLSTLTGDLTLSKCVIDKELIAGTNITLTEDAQGKTTIDASGGGASSLSDLTDCEATSSNKLFIGSKPTTTTQFGNNTIVIGDNYSSNANLFNSDNLIIGNSINYSSSSNLVSIGFGNMSNLQESSTSLIVGNYNNYSGSDVGNNLNFNICIGHQNTLSNTASSQVVIGYNITGCGLANSLTMPNFTNCVSPSNVIVQNSTTKQWGPLSNVTVGYLYNDGSNVSYQSLPAPIIPIASAGLSSQTLNSNTIISSYPMSWVINKPNGYFSVSGSFDHLTVITPGIYEITTNFNYIVNNNVTANQKFDTGYSVNGSIVYTQHQQLSTGIESCGSVTNNYTASLGAGNTLNFFVSNTIQNAIQLQIVWGRMSIKWLSTP